MKQYTNLVNYVLNNGTLKENRTGTDTLSTFGVNYSHDLRTGFPILTTKEISWKNIVVENLWFLTGKRDIKPLWNHDIKFWNPWADKNGRIPSAYGFYWRYFDGVDQIKWALNELKQNPYSRRVCISAWHPVNASISKLPPCHAFWVLNVQNINDQPHLCLHLTQRSADIGLGVPYNLAGYSFLLTLFGKLVDLPVAYFNHTMVDAHIYVNHIEPLKEQISRSYGILPRMIIDDSIQSLEDAINVLTMDTDQVTKMFRLRNYAPHPPISMEVSV